MSFEFILRIIGMIVLAMAGAYWGFNLSKFTPSDGIRTTLIFGLVGALTGLILTPYFTTRPARTLRSLLGRLAAESLFAGLTGLVAGLLIAALLAFPLSLLPQPFSQILPFIGVLIFSYFGVSLFVMRQGDIMGLLSAISGRGESGSSSSWTNLNRNILLDTSVIIDGRIADICETGFLDGTLVIPQFVLKELQMVADSSDPMKRNRGRRGLDILQKVQKMANVDVVISDTDFPQVREVDSKLIELARVMQGKIVTNDFNLNKVAQLRGVEVLNINELANALKPVVLPGEVMKVFILKEGKEYNQGVAYLDDGTMVVVDNARRMISKNIDIVVTSVLQTTAGKMIFGRYIESQQGASAGQSEVQGAVQGPPPDGKDRVAKSR